MDILKKNLELIVIGLILVVSVVLIFTAGVKDVGATTEQQKIYCEPSPTPTMTEIPTVTPTSAPTMTQTPAPTATGAPGPTATPIPGPTATPSPTAGASAMVAIPNSAPVTGRVE